jgi:hypothetical protein
MGSFLTVDFSSVCSLNLLSLYMILASKNIGCQSMQIILSTVFTCAMFRYFVMMI